MLCKSVQDAGAGLVAAAMISVVPGYISRSVAGSYDNEGIAIFCMLLTYAMWIKAVKSGSMFWAVLCSLAYFYMVTTLWCWQTAKCICYGTSRLPLGLASAQYISKSLFLKVCHRLYSKNIYVYF